MSFLAFEWDRGVNSYLCMYGQIKHQSRRSTIFAHQSKHIQHHVILYFGIFWTNFRMVLTILRKNMSHLPYNSFIICRTSH